MADDDPIRSDERQLGHLYLMAQPEVASEEMFLDLLARRDAMQALPEKLDQIRRDRGNAPNGFAPDMEYLRYRIPRAEGMALPPTAPRTAQTTRRAYWSWPSGGMAGSGSSAGGEPTLPEGQDAGLRTDRR